jgi:hypothetical protein
MTGAARLGLTVSLLGSAYLVRRPLLDELGFALAHRLEDIDLSLRLLARRKRIAWAPDARCAHRPPADAAAFRAQRTAWGRGYHRVAADHLREAVGAARSPAAAIDCLLFCGGYLDRLSFAAGVALCAAQALGAPELWAPWWLLALCAAVPIAQVPVAALADGWSLRRIAGVVPALALAALDLLAEGEALLADLLRRPLRWARQRRAGEGQ